MKDIGDNLLRESRRPHGGRWLELWEFEIDASSTALLKLAIVNHSAPITFGGITYYPFPVGRGPIEWDSEGNLPRTTVALDNRGRALTHYLEQGHGFQDRVVYWRLVHESWLALATDRLPMQWIVSGVRVSAETINFDLEARAFRSSQLPHDRFMRDRCAWQFRSEECGYEPDATQGANFRTCDKSLVDCLARGDDEEARGLPVLHPMQYGGFPALPRRVR